MIGGDFINKQAAFTIFGTMFAAMGVFLLLVAIMAKSAPLTETYTLLSMAIMSFSLSYLYPEFMQKDERMNMIRQKGMYFSVFAFLIYSFILTTVLRLDLFQLTAIEAINILLALMISTIFISWVVLARKYWCVDELEAWRWSSFWLYTLPC